MATEHFDVLIIGAGISGIGAGYYLTTESKGKSFAILERRQAIGGTWDLFRYPGIRSDSDMYTFGYAFKPWTNPKVISDGESIREYVKETAREYGIEKKIRFGIKVVRMNWDPAEAAWTVDAVREATGERLTYTAGFLIGATGYYNYDQGYTPEFPGRERFKGDIIHPQHWPENYDYSGKRVVIIGSGATAVTLIPSMTDKAKHVTMLQRSPSYVMTLPERDAMGEGLYKRLPQKLAYGIARARNVSLQIFFYQLSRRKPALVKRFLRSQVRKQIGGNFDMGHFTPKYDPWDERLCAVPDGDLFKVLKEGKASVVTDQIDTFTEKGIRLKSGKELEADLIITATGLNLQLLGGAELSVAGKPYEFGQSMAYRALMFDGLPNFAMMFGYPNASWTMKVDISCQYLVRLFKYMDKHGYKAATPRNTDRTLEKTRFFALQSGYVKRAEHTLPSQGNKFPWKVYNNYWLDRVTLRNAPINDGVMEFSRMPSRAKATVA